MGRQRSRRNNGLEPNLYIERGKYFKYLHPQTKKWIRFGTNKVEANAAAKILNARYAEKENLIEKAEEVNVVSVGDVITEYIQNEIPNLPWDVKTKQNNIFKLNRFNREFGSLNIKSITRTFLLEWLSSNTPSNESYNKNLDRLVDLFSYARSLGYVNQNEAEMVRRRSLSLKIAANRKTRTRLEMKEFWVIHDQAPHWLQVAMELSLVTLQARMEITNMKYTDIRDGFIYVIRDKTSGDSDMAFIRIEVTDQIKEIIARSRSDAIVSPFVVHYSPLRKRASQMNAKAHWTSVTPNHATKTFKAVRDSTGLFSHLQSPERPTFHEIRSLGAREYEKLGYDRDYIRSLMTHSDQKTTRIYLSGGRLTDDNYVRVKADLVLNDLK